ncbi:MAG: porin [Candidatus Omnitrophica bacterium]|nr:porin [Candidatus Omnitrophota bacterium]
MPSARRRFSSPLLILSLVSLAAPSLSRAAEVNGIWSEASTKDAGDWTGVSWLKKIKIRGWFESYFVHNTNEPSRTRVNSNQGSSIVKATNTTIEGRTFDIHNDVPRISLIELELEKVPTLGEWGGAGFKLDVNWGDTPEIIYDTIQGALGEGVVHHADKWIQHASVGWVAPVGKGLRVDAGKLVTHIGAETIEGIKNNHLSHGLLYSYAIPFQDTGFRLNYPWSDKIYTELYVVRGWNVTTGDNNSGWTYGPSVGWLPNAWFNFYLNYLVGPEQRNNTSNLRHLVDFQAFINNPIPKLNLILFGDVGYEENALNSGARNAHWNGFGGIARYQVTDHLEPAVRMEYLHDRDGFATGVAGNMYSVTATLNYKMALGKGFSFLVRPEYRFDKSSENFFSSGSAFRSQTTQHTVGVGAYIYF